MSTTIGVIADTHGLLRPEAIDVLRGCDFILHAGDIGRQAVLSELEFIAPTYAIGGNIDKGGWAQDLPQKDFLEIDGCYFYLTHSLEALDLDPAAADIDAVIFGHTHWPESYTKEGVLYFNPGSAGPLRQKSTVSMGRIYTLQSGLTSEIITLTS